jgi:SAM-dependent methyltransferase
MSYFNEQAKLYAEFRPDYPAALFTFIAGLSPRRQLALDCATGNGQAAVGLAEHFDRVIAIDSAAGQIAHARPHPRIEYRVASAEESGVPDACVDVVTVTQALHWLDFDRFYREVRRVAAPGAAIVITVYGDAVLEDPKLNPMLQHYNKQIVGPYWPPERKIVDDGYRTIPFPFNELPTPQLTLERYWRLDELAGYLRSWSATVRFAKQNGRDPVTQLEDEIRALWGDSQRTRLVQWPFIIRAGRVN